MSINLLNKIDNSFIQQSLLERKNPTLKFHLIDGSRPSLVVSRAAVIFENFKMKATAILGCKLPADNLKDLPDWDPYCADSDPCIRKAVEKSLISNPEKREFAFKASSSGKTYTRLIVKISEVTGPLFKFTHQICSHAEALKVFKGCPKGICSGGIAGPAKNGGCR